VKTMRVDIGSSARLHLGFYTISASSMAYGSMGVAINKPEVVVQVRKADGLEIRNSTQVTIEKDVKEVIKRLNLPGAEINVLKAIPRHVGLGSTTQLRLSIGYALSRIYGLKYSIRRLAFIIKRGTVSGIGIAAFKHGGFILDSGRLLSEDGIREPKNPAEIPNVMLRRLLPKSWRFIVAIPKGIRGLDEREEKPVLETPETNHRLERELHDTVLLHMLPALARGDAENFGRALTKVQRLVGQYFSKFQGGEFYCWETEEMVKSLLDGGAYGAGQSSWGPTTYGLIEGSKRAQKLLDYMIRSAEKAGVEAEIFIVQPRNRGFSCRIVESQ